MIQELSVQDFAIISNLNIEFKEGMTVLTGETGAGKSIIIDAMGLIVGGRGSSDFIRDGAEKCRIEGSFYVESNQEMDRYLADCGIEMVDDVLVVQREIYRTGRNNCRINGQLVNTKTLRGIGQYLVDIHGQNEHQELMEATHHLGLLDQFDVDRLTPVLADYRIHYTKFKELEMNLKKFHANEKEYVQRMDMLQFQFEEINEAELLPNEEEQLLEERKKLVSFQQITDGLKNTYNAINGDESQALDLVAQAMNEMSSIEDLDPSYKETSELIQTSYYSLQEALTNVSAFVDDLELDESRLLEVESRLDVIRQLKRKYGETVEKILEHFEYIKEELSLSEFGGLDVEQVERDLESEKELVDSLGRELSQCRKETAGNLEENILTELKSLFMENTRFKVMFTELDKPNETGLDKVEFFISTNLGEDLKPLVKVASGGELSRVMLAIKTIFSKNHGMTSIVFDEVDTGVSGRVAQAIAEKIHQIGTNSQVLCITHLPQVAAIADTQYFIKKEIINKRTETSVSELAATERVDEVARMLSGAEITPLTLEHAKELLSIAQKK